MSKKFLSDVLIECGLQVDGTTTLGTATATTVATSDNSTNIATTAWVKSLGYSTTDSYVSGVSLNGNLLSFTGVNSAFTGSIDLSSIISSFNASDVETVYERVKNTSGSIIYKGTPLAVAPGQTSGNISDVVPADAADPAKMPAVFIANEDIADEAEGEAVLFGRFSGVDTSLYQSGTTVYVAAGGGWTATKPVYPNLIQNLGVITKQHATNGGGVVTGVGRANALPNLTAGKIWVGSASYPIESTTVHVDEANGRVGIGTTSPAQKLDINGNAIVRTRLSIGGDMDSVASSNDMISMWGSALGSRIKFGTNGTFYGRILSNTSDMEFEQTGGGFTFSRSTAVSMRITNGGNVGIGTTNPTAKLHVVGNIYNDTGRIYTDDIRGFSANTISIGDGATTFNLVSRGGKDFVITGGNVGIGTTSPQYALDVKKDATSILNLYRPNSSTAAVSDLDFSFNTANATESVYARIRADVETNTDLAQGGDLSFHTANNGTVSEKMRITQEGNVGIGTTTPGTKLHVGAGSGATVDTGYQLAVDSAGIAGVQILAATNQSSRVVFGDSDDNDVGMLRYDHTDNSMRFITNGSSNERMRIDASGNVGIGTTSPVSKLDVAGELSADYTFYLAADGSANYTASRIRLFSHNNYRGSGTFFTGVDSTWFIGTPYTDFSGGFIIARKSAATSYEDTAQYSNALFTVKSTGNVGIGTTSPSYLLDVNGSGRIGSGIGTGVYVGNTSHAVWTRAGGTNGNMALYSGGSDRITIVGDSGNVGIGTTSPAVTLEANGKVRSTRSGVASQYLEIDGGTAGAVYLTASGASKPLVIQNNNTTQSDIWFDQAVASTYLWLQAGTERMRITSAGNVGIGTTSPATKFHVHGYTTIDSVDVVATFSSDNTDKRVNIGYSTSGDYGFINAVHTGVAWKNLIFGVNGGNVGIGTTSPNYKLDVAGNAYFQSYVSTSSYYVGPLYKVTYGGSYNGFNSVSNEAILARVSSTSGIINYAEYAINNLNGYVIGQSDAMIKGNYSSDDLYILTTNAVRFYVASNSNGGGVGIGTAFNDSVPPQEKLHVKGKIRIDDSSTSATLSTYSQICNGGTSVYEILDIASTYGAFVDYVIYDNGRDNMRAGTFKATWNSNETVYSDGSTVDIGDTTQVELTSQINGTDVELAVTGPTQFTVKFSIKVIR